MKAVIMTKAGSPEVLEYTEIAEPEIMQPTQVKVKIRAAGVNPIDTKVRRMAMFYPDKLPAVLGCDLAGEVVAIGAGVTEFNIGDKVWACHGGLGDEQGCYAEFSVLDQRWLSLMPDISFTTAAAAPLVLITAWGALFDRGRLQAGETVLIHAGAGGVGHVAVQLAKHKGARVITTVSTVEKAEFVKLLGADEVILYSQENVLERVNALTGGQGVNLVLDTVGGDVFVQSIPLIAYFGRIVTLLAIDQVDLSEARVRNLSIAFELMLTPLLRHLDRARDQHVAILKQCVDRINAGELQIYVEQIMPLAKASQAHSKVEQGHGKGKVVLELVE
ncbi:zinc-dependent alcohol dehydrogenase family protein [methanotrophic endosymbiont of Bathymodiolus puteoserpentis (Logatchev)]|uniref:zinc-dependent alcohol dehydrogenase family protein n=1 Tax=methanotrophic endosymbiont of Bathymodiolus puteoserpentis (Logatchev) TaxID=343235 RepID=UPI0013CA215A|nr:zinc-dependent alcohol dehydrogenase family protein [methanotrophic endosymbiont of Bathymodiolus puteoserpentis (Logatchev)]SHE22051.1 Bifunctional protein: zinc-containing alcohol dehydrogenase; quinone oxidoreductase (NADPH:quinone reductase); Similar to arginate lyase [methanotrophic endosymbiont of Bathymodiolus puteoserpentis (Logatchev)]